MARLVPFASGVELGVHAHDDLGLATAVSLAALEAGATWCDVTVCGIGERAGNAALEQMVLVCQRAGLGTQVRPRKLRHLASLALSVMGREVSPDQPIVGAACFTHQSGLHQAAMVRDPGCYEPFDPKEIGAKRSLSIGRHLGRAGLARALSGLSLPVAEEDVARLLQRVTSVATHLGRSLTDDELLAVVHEPPGPMKSERRRPWPSTNPLTTSSSATASA